MIKKLLFEFSILFGIIGTILLSNSNMLIAATNHFNGPLRLHPDNPRYFTDNSGRAIYLTGSHTWANLQEIGLPEGPVFPWNEYLEMMVEHNHNFMRFWVWEQPERAPWTEDKIRFTPLPWARTGPGKATDGKPKFNLGKWNEVYFKRMRERIEAAGKRGIYVAIMLFQGWSLNKTATVEGDPWPVHPYNPVNNVQNMGAQIGTADEDGKATVHSLLNPELLAYQESYVRKVIDTVNDQDNVLFEIINEGGAIDWQIHMINFIHGYEKSKSKQHPVGMTHRISPKMFNEELLESPAEWVSFAGEPLDWLTPGSVYLQDYRADPPACEGHKVSVLDTDHLWGHGGNPVWVWKSFMRGHNPIFMDPWWSLGGRLNPENVPWMFIEGGISKDTRDYPNWEPVRVAMGQTKLYADKMNLAAMTPRGDLASTRYCLTNPGEEYLVYFPEGGSATLNLYRADGDYRVEWFVPSQNRTLVGPETLKGGDYIVLTAPFTGDTVLYLKKIK